ncbi:hypothetical protein PI124_g12111 [Phytophthora idaei]|nr:hypothetical protein PI125_g10529 [Phytophthora idaei]KAG3154783.1 hypothetical protein PI126_g9462 [Phytophthora idaei]KAG3243069.1 hypothetical protein PI124_g12111 [Phytophthora idaei]
MVRNSGTTDYSMSEIDRLLALVVKILSLGKDEWERLAATYNTSKLRGAAERDYESLRRKFKALYSTRKPTGMPDMPPHIKKAKEIKMAIDERADVVEMDAGADTDQRLVETDLCFDVDPDESFYEDCDEDSARLSTGIVRTLNGHADVTATYEFVGENSSESTCSSNRGEFQELLTSSLDSEGLEAFARTPHPAPARSEPSDRRPGSGCLPLSRKSPATPRVSEVPQPANLPLVIDLASGSRDKLEELKYPKLQRFSNRLGTNLTTFREGTSGVKRVLEPDSDTLEASFAKAKRMRAMKTTSALKSKLYTVETSASNMRGSILETILLLREEYERKAELRRAEEDQRRMDELAARETHRIAEKAEADERRRAEKLEMEDRARRDREEARHADRCLNEEGLRQARRKSELGHDRGSNTLHSECSVVSIN